VPVLLLAVAGLAGGLSPDRPSTPGAALRARTDRGRLRGDSALRAVDGAQVLRGGAPRCAARRAARRRVPGAGIPGHTLRSGRASRGRRGLHDQHPGGDPVGRGRLPRGLPGAVALHHAHARRVRTAPARPVHRPARHDGAHRRDRLPRAREHARTGTALVAGARAAQSPDATWERGPGAGRAPSSGRERNAGRALGGHRHRHRGGLLEHAASGVCARLYERPDGCAVPGQARLLTPAELAGLSSPHRLEPPGRAARARRIHRWAAAHAPALRLVALPSDGLCRIQRLVHRPAVDAALRCLAGQGPDTALRRPQALSPPDAHVPGPDAGGSSWSEACGA